MSDYVYHRDLLDDTYYHKDPHTPLNIVLSNPLYTLGSKIYSKPVNIMVLAGVRPCCYDIDDLLKMYFEKRLNLTQANNHTRVYDCNKVCYNRTLIHGSKNVNERDRSMRISS